MFVLVPFKRGVKRPLCPDKTTVLISSITPLPESCQGPCELTSRFLSPTVVEVVIVITTVKLINYKVIISNGSHSGFMISKRRGSPFSCTKRRDPLILVYSFNFPKINTSRERYIYSFLSVQLIDPHSLRPPTCLLGVRFSHPRF